MRCVEETSDGAYDWIGVLLRLNLGAAQGPHTGPVGNPCIYHPAYADKSEGKTKISALFPNLFWKCGACSYAYFKI